MAVGFQKRTEFVRLSATENRGRAESAGGRSLFIRAAAEESPERASEPVEDGARFGHAEEVRGGEVEQAVREQDGRGEEDGVEGGRQEFESPSGGRAEQGRGPELRHERGREARAADASVERAAEQ